MTTNEVAELYEEVEAMKANHPGFYPMMLRFAESFLRYGEGVSGRENRPKQRQGELTDDPCLRENQIPG